MSKHEVHKFSQKQTLTTVSILIYKGEAFHGRGTLSNSMDHWPTSVLCSGFLSCVTSLMFYIIKSIKIMLGRDHTFTILNRDEQ